MNVPSRALTAALICSCSAGCFDPDLDSFALQPDGTETTVGTSEAASIGATSSTGSMATTGSSNELLVDDFEDGDTLASNGFGWWYAKNDTSGDQDFRISEVADRPGSTRAAHSSGVGFDVWGALVGLDTTPGSGLYDASAFTQLRFWARAAPDSVTSFSARLLEGGDLQFETPIELTTQWQQYSLRFDQLSEVDRSTRTIDSSRIAALQIFLFSEQRFDFWIDDVIFAAGP